MEPLTTIDIAFYVVYLSEVLLVSLYLPSLLARRARGLIRRYPPSDYPKLYPVPAAAIERALRLCLHANTGVGALGLALLAAAWRYGYTIDPVWYYGDVPAKSLAGASVAYTGLQMLALTLFPCCEALYFKRMRSAPRDGAIRSAELKARRLADFISPALVNAAAAMYVAAAVATLFLGTSSIRNAPFIGTYMFGVMTLTNLCIVGWLVWLLRGTRQDPHQADGDRARTFRVSAKYLAVLSILVSGSVAISCVLIAFKLTHYTLFVHSLYVTALSLALIPKLFLTAFGHTNFDVYKVDSRRKAALTTHE